MRSTYRFLLPNFVPKRREEVLFEFLHPATGEFVLDEPDVPQVKRNILHNLREKNHWFAYGVRNADLIKNIRVSTSAIGNNNLRGTDCIPDLRHYRSRTEEVISARGLAPQLVDYRYDMIIVNRLQFGSEWHHHKNVRLLLDFVRSAEKLDGRVPAYADEIYGSLRATRIKIGFVSVPPTLHKGADKALVLQR